MLTNDVILQTNSRSVLVQSCLQKPIDDMFSFDVKYNTLSTSLKIIEVEGNFRKDIDPNRQVVIFDIPQSQILQNMWVNVGFTIDDPNDDNFDDNNLGARIFKKVSILNDKNEVLASYNWQFLYANFLMSKFNESMIYQSLFNGSVNTYDNKTFIEFNIPFFFFFLENYYNSLFTNIYGKFRLVLEIANGIEDLGMNLITDNNNYMILKCLYRSFTGVEQNTYMNFMKKNVKQLAYDTFTTEIDIDVTKTFTNIHKLCPYVCTSFTLLFYDKNPNLGPKFGFFIFFINERSK